MCDDYPYSDFHEMNLDWILDKIQELEGRIVQLEETVEELRGDEGGETV